MLIPNGRRAMFAHLSHKPLQNFQILQSYFFTIYKDMTSNLGHFTEFKVIFQEVSMDFHYQTENTVTKVYTTV